MLDDIDQLTFDDADDLLLSGERRVPCVFLADRSGSMSGAKIDALNHGLHVYHRQISSNDMAKKRVETAIVSFGPVKVEHDFATVDNMKMPRLQPAGMTPMGEAILEALRLLDERQKRYDAAGVPKYAPWMFLMTDGESTDCLKAARKEIKRRESRDKLFVFTIGVEGANFDELKTISKVPPIALNGVNFTGLFEFASKLMNTVSASKPGERITIPNPAEEGFGEIVL